jgi:hypothetical protein
MQNIGQDLTVNWVTLRQSFKAQWLLYVPSGLTSKNTVECYVFCTRLRIRTIVSFFFERFIEKKLCTTCPRTNYTIVLLTNLNEYLYDGKSGIKGNINNSSEKVQNNTANGIHVQY